MNERASSAAEGDAPEGGAPAPAASVARVYANAGNAALCALLAPGVRRVLDVGCGDGANAALLRAARPGLSIEGITHVPEEAELARRHLDRCWLLDLERDFPAELGARPFDALLCSHVLEHLREPSRVLGRLAGLLRSGGQVLIAVPNVLGWRQRLAFLAGRFDYTQHGVLDATHLRFFTYHSAGRELLSEAPTLRLVSKHVTGSVPLGVLRRHVLPRALSARLDVLGCRVRPNLFGAEVLLEVNKQ